MNRTRTVMSHRSQSRIAIALAVFIFVAALTIATYAAGDLDHTFGNGGKVITDFRGRHDFALDMALQSDGKIVVVGSDTDYSAFAVARYNNNGSLDSTFGTGGKVSTDFAANFETARSVAIQSDGKIIVSGFITTGSPGLSDFAVARYDNNGALDSTFGSGGKVVTDFFGNNDVATSMALQTDNKIVIAGYVTNASVTDFGLARFNSNGSLDTSFDFDGKATTDIFEDDAITALALYTDGRILAVGYSGSFEDFSLARYNGNGSLDTSFDTDGKVRTDFGLNLRDRANAVAIQPDNKIVVAGSTSVQQAPPQLAFGLMRYNNDGSLDSTFDGDGKTHTKFFNSPDPFGGSGDEIPYDLAITADGKILVAGFTAIGDFTFSRYLSNGSLDTNFGYRGRLFSHLSLQFSRATAVAIQTDGRILAAGYGPSSPNIPSDSDFFLARYEANPKSIPVRSDFDLDAKSDITVFRPSDGTWYVLNSSNGTVSAQPFGTSGDIAVPGDYDGDGGGTDFAVFRPSNGTWYILQSANSAFRAEQFGTTGDVPVPADYDGDGKTDIAVFRPSVGTWYMLHSSDNSFHAQPFGISTDRPVPGYYDGDGKADIAVFRDNIATWYIMESSTNAMRAQGWGISGDQPVQADYDGDGKFDLAVYRPGNNTWYIQNSFTGSLFSCTWGVAGDRPVPADYNGDFKNDIAVWRPSNGTWYITALPNIGIQSFTFGTNGDTPAAAAYLP